MSDKLIRFEAFSDRLLRVGEIWAVLVLTGLIWIAAIATAGWIVHDPACRLPEALKVLNANWKACLLLLAPLFYRTIRVVLERMKKFPFGMEAQEPEETEQGQPNPKPKQAEH